MAPPKFPDVLTDAQWQKHKNAWVKMVGGATKMGAQLRELKKDFDDVDWDAILSIAKFDSIEDLGDWRLANEGVRASTLKVFVDTVKDTADLADKVKAEFDKNKLMPPGAKTHIAAIVTGLAAFRKLINAQFDKVTISYDKQLKELKAKEAAEEESEEGDKTKAKAIIKTDAQRAANKDKEVKLKIKAKPDKPS